MKMKLLNILFNRKNYKLTIPEFGMNNDNKEKFSQLDSATAQSLIKYMEMESRLLKEAQDQETLKDNTASILNRVRASV